jgi:hypothetical protein
LLEGNCRYPKKQGNQEDTGENREGDERNFIQFGSEPTKG